MNAKNLPLLGIVLGMAAFLAVAMPPSGAYSNCYSQSYHGTCSNPYWDQVCVSGACGSSSDCQTQGSLGTCQSTCTQRQCLAMGYVLQPCYQWGYLTQCYVAACVSQGICEGYTTSCSYTACSANKANCDLNQNNGCEVTTSTDSNNCGSCGHVCSSGQVCQAGACVTQTDFSVSPSPASGIVNAGDVKTTNVTVNLTLGSTASVSLAASNLPSGASASFSPASCSPSCYSNMTITTTSATPAGSKLVSITGTSGSTVRSGTYNLTVLPNSSATCGNLVCEYPETQSTCSVDCNTTTVIPSPVAPGQVVAISVEFWDFRYQAGQPVQIDLTLNPGSTAWTPDNGCFFGGKKMASSSGNGAIAWPAGTVSQDGHFKISTSCTVPATITAGPHTLVATPTIF